MKATARYFHISHVKWRDGNLQTGFTVKLDEVRGPTKPLLEDVEYWQDLRTESKQQFPDGISPWGRMHYLGLHDDEFIAKRERHAEDLRRQHFVDHLSRFQAFFCCGNLLEAIRFRNGFKVPDATIWEVEHFGTVERRDMAWLGRCNDVELNSRLLQYWQGQESATPIWEYLLKPPASIPRRVPQEEINSATDSTDSKNNS